MSDVLTKKSQIDKERKTEEINLVPIFYALLKKVWLIILTAVIVAGAFFGGTRLLITPTYRASFTAFVNNRSQLKNDYDTLSSSDIIAAQDLVQTYSEILKSRRILISAAESVGIDYSYGSLKDMVKTEIANDTQILTVYVVSESPQEAYALANAIADLSPDYASAIVEGSSMKIIDSPQMPTGIYKPNYIRNTAIGLLLGAVAAVAYVLIRFLLDDRVKAESELEERFAIPVVGVIPDMNSTGKSGSNYYEYEYAYRYSNIKRSGEQNG